MTLQQKFHVMKKQLEDRHRVPPDVFKTLDSAYASLFEIKPVTREMRVTGARLLEVSIDVLVRDDPEHPAIPLLREFYDSVCEHYKLENKYCASGEGQAPSHEAV